MKQYAVVVALIFSGLSPAFAIEGNLIDAAGKRQGHWVITGAMKNDRDYAPGAKVEEGDYHDGLKVGVWITYFPNGYRKSEFTFVNNRPNGPAVIYFENGKKAEEGTWVVNRWVGEYHLYYEDGTERQHFNYSQVGQREGKQVYRNPDGSLQIVVEMKGGKENGWKREYDENGNLVRETYFNNGVIDNSKTREYAKAKPSQAPEDPAAAPRQETPPPPPAAPSDWNGNGPYTLMKNGQVSQKGTFHNYRLVDGEARFYDSNGMLVQIKIYKNGKYAGDAPIPADANK
jgi:antitoxin component YwqK of YwqJK toxin-antitoxin module